MIQNDQGENAIDLCHSPERPRIALAKTNIRKVKTRLNRKKMVPLRTLAREILTSKNSNGAATYRWSKCPKNQVCKLGAKQFPKNRITDYLSLRILLIIITDFVF